jgi:hypothetical protein
MKKANIAKALVSLVLFAPLISFADSTVIATAGAGANVSPSGTVIVASGITQTFSIGADQGFQVSDVSLDGTSVGPVDSVDFTGIDVDALTHTLDVSATSLGGGSLPYYSGPYAPGWNVSLPGGGCGGTGKFVPAGSAGCPFWFPEGFMEN